MVIVWYVIMQVGMCHVSEVADHYVKNIEKHYKVGDRVRARILKVCKAQSHVLHLIYTSCSMLCKLQGF
jgi:predicted RNA-binding protein with RPS1 domain